MRSKSAGFTIIELIVVCFIIMILLGLLLPAILFVRASSEKLACSNNLRQIGIAMHNNQAGKGVLFEQNTNPPYTHDVRSQLSWMVLILPELEDSNFYDQAVRACQIGFDPLKNPPHTGLTAIKSFYICPSDSRLTTPLTDPNGLIAAYTGYIGIAGVFSQKMGRTLGGAFSMTRPSISNISDGSSNTILVSERTPPDSAQAGWWYPRLYMNSDSCHGPNGVIILGKTNYDCKDCSLDGRLFGVGKTDNPCDRFHLWSLHPGGANFLFADCSVHFLKYTSNNIISDLATIRGGEIAIIPD